MEYRRSGRSGLQLPAISLGLWHNFGGVDNIENARAIIRRAFDLGVTYFDLANNYGPPPGSAEETFGRILTSDLQAYRDEVIVSTKAGYYMWPGPYGEWGSKKNLVSSLDQSLKRLQLDYVDIFYSHRPDPFTPMEETMSTLDQIVRSGKALYVGLSNYDAEETKQAVTILKSLGTPLTVHQPSYSLLDRWIEDGLMSVLTEEGIGSVAYTPLAQGILTDRYLTGIPAQSRASKAGTFLSKDDITSDVIEKARRLNEIARERGQTLAQMSLAWVLREGKLTSAITGASRVEQVEQNVQALENTAFSSEELTRIDAILAM